MENAKHEEHEGPVFAQLFRFFAIAACIKVLLIPAYRSTDFEVHRHWLALAHSLPLSHWYTDESSQWTLDYPPFFAYFEYILSFFAHRIDPKIVDISRGLNYDSLSVLYFQRISVIISDLCLLFGVYRVTRSIKSEKRLLFWILVIWSPGLLIVDHIHFQYNGFLLGLLMLSISFLQEERDILGGFLFAVLLCFKHLFSVGAPLFFVYLFRHYCCKNGLLHGFMRLVAIGALVTVVFAAAYGPFLLSHQMDQVVNRLFPFGRGLCHAYWAPNFWVFYILLDKAIYSLLSWMGFKIHMPEAAFTGGLVGGSSPFAVLPPVTPLSTFLMVMLALVPCLVKAWKHPDSQLIADWVAYCYTSGFLFGWHVHEKASLHFVIPLAIIAIRGAQEARHYFLLTIATCYSLFPLLHEPQEYPIKVLLLLSHSIITWHCFSSQFPRTSSSNFTSQKETNGAAKLNASLGNGGFGIGKMEALYCVGFLLVEAWGKLLHPLLFNGKFPFLPLLLVSTYSAVMIMYSWSWQLRRILLS